MRSFAAVLCGLAVIGAAASAQTVRGIVSESGTRAPLGGVLVTLVRDSASSGTALVTSLTNDRGAFVIRVPAPGQYRVVAKRIGVRRFLSPVLELAAGQERALDITLEPVVFSLPEVFVTTTPVCASRSAEADRLASLWEEARTALTATQISLRDRLFRARVVRYRRQLDPRTLHVESETRRQQTEGVFDRPFVSVSGDSLSRYGYWRVEPDNMVSYFAPDADILLSDAFLKDHCFSIAEGRGDRAGLVGMSFEPRAGRNVPEVRGTLWMDARTFELRLVEFRYTRLPAASNMSHVGGEVHFARLPSGAWVVHRWYIRTPNYSDRTSTRSSGVPGERPVTVAVVVALTEEGGNVTAEGLRSAERPARLTGVVSDSSGGALPGAALRLQGTRFLTRTDSSGRFRFDSLPPGSYTLVADHFDYEALGMVVGQQNVNLTEGAALDLSLRAPGSAAIVARLCDGKEPVRRMATLRVTILDSATALPVRNLALKLSWKEFGGTSSLVRIEPNQLRVNTDPQGSVAFCALPPDYPLHLVILRDDRTETPLAEVRLRQDEIDARVFRIAVRR